MVWPLPGLSAGAGGSAADASTSCAPPHKKGVGIQPTAGADHRHHRQDEGFAAQAPEVVVLLSVGPSVGATSSAPPIRRRVS